MFIEQFGVISFRFVNQKMLRIQPPTELNRSATPHHNIVLMPVVVFPGLTGFAGLDVVFPSITVLRAMLVLSGVAPYDKEIVEFLPKVIHLIPDTS